MTLTSLSTATAGLNELRGSWIRSLKAGNKSPRTIESYLHALDGFTRWCVDNGRPVDPTVQRRRDVEEYIAWILDRWTPGTAGVRYRGLRQWFRWLVREDEADDVMAGMSHPKLEEIPPPIIPDDDLTKLLEACKGRGFMERRDTAILRVLIDTGMRRGELAGLTLGDVDLDGQVLRARPHQDPPGPDRADRHQSRRGDRPLPAGAGQAS